ncbi:restriction endonuclease subunit S [Bacillus halotolerans]|uniref:restriction endonuclease subunit S n=1 Tax=Bacillus halotolerans TaxID=260554 RepID=UPI003D221EF4
MNVTLKDRLKKMSIGEVPQGYVTTSEGIFPNDWKVVQLQEVVRVFRGASPRPKGDPRYYGGDIPRVLIEDVTRDGKYVYPCIDSLTEEGAKKSRLLPKDSVILSCSGTRVAIPGILGESACIHDGFFGFDSYDGLLPEYLYYFFLLLHEKMQSSATKGGVFNNLTTQIMKEMYIQLPSLFEQEKIIDKIKPWDKAIELKEKLIKQKKEQKKGITQKLLTGEVRLPGFKDKWKKVEFGDVLNLIKKDPIKNPEDYYLLTVKLHLKGIEGTDKKPNVTTKGRPYYLRESNELLIGRQNFHNGGIGIVPENMKNYVASNAISSVGAIKGNLTFYYYYLSNPNFYKKIEHIIGGTGQKEISEAMMKKLKLFIPVNEDEQTAIKELLEIIDKEINLLEEELFQLKEQKKGLMQLLLTGKVRVKA